jgi:sugar lactone lactonase YvrE
MKTMKKILSISLLFLINNTNAQIITTVVGNGTNGYSGDGGQATAAEIYAPNGLAFDAAGNLYIADSGNNLIRKVTTSGIITTFAGNGTHVFSGDGGQATAAGIYGPTGVACDAAGNLYIADSYNFRVRKVTTSGIITTFAGNGTNGFSGDGGQATDAGIFGPGGITFDASGNLYIADNDNSYIRKVNTAGIITTYAGNGTSGYSGDGGQATDAEIDSQYGICCDATGNLYIAEFDNYYIRKVSTSGIITTVAGNGTGNYSGDGGLATAAGIYNPTFISCDVAGNLYIADFSNQRIREVTTAGIITTVAGNGTAGYSGYGGLATAAQIYNPGGITFDAIGNMYIADNADSRIRMICNASCATTSMAQVATYKKQVTIYPNPASDIVTIQSATELGLVTIYNSLGAIVYTQKVNANQQRIDLSKQAAGIYFLQTQNAYLKIIKE